MRIMLTINRAYKFRVYPTATQRLQFAKDAGCVRFVWNRGLALRSAAYKERAEKITGIDISRMVTLWKKEEATAWLKEANSTVLTQALRDQDTAFKNFFAKRARYPNFKRYENAQSARYQLDQRLIARTYTAGHLLVLPKMGPLKVRWSQIPQGTPKMVTFTKDAAGRYFISFSCEEAHLPLAVSDVGIGIDLGIKDIVVTSDGWKSGNPRHLKKYLRRLKHQQRNLSRKTKGSNRRKKAVRQVAKIHAKIGDTRQDWTQKLTTHLLGQAGTIAMEDLHVKGMVRNRCLSRVISDAAWGEIRRQIAYKAAWNGRLVLLCGRFVATTKTCSDCDFIIPEMSLSVRVWTCPACGVTHDRDINAARNIWIKSTGGRPGSYARGGRKTPSGDPAIAFDSQVALLAPDETRTSPNIREGCLDAA